MLKKQDRALFIALLAIAAAIVLCWAVPRPQGEQQNSVQSCTTHECREDAATERVAFYTEALAWFTAALVLTASFQGYFLIRADQTARMSADAARKIADATLSTERARIFIKVEGENIESRIREIIRDRESGPSINSDNPLVVVYRLVNHGKTPAIIHTVFATIRVKPWPDSPPENFGFCWPAEQRNGTVISGNSEADRPERCRHVEVFDFGAIEKVLEDGESGPENAVWFFGEVTYSDVFDNKWHHRFLWRFDGYNGQFQPDEYKDYGKST